MTLSAEFFLQILVAIGSGASVYAAIRADLARLHEIATNAAKVGEGAHRRIDEIMDHRAR